MDDSFDLSGLFASWPFDPDDNVRRIVGPNGREVLQVRLPLGLEQYELQGRPDGERPYGKESVLDFHLERLAEAQRSGGESEFGLNSEQCEELFNEGTLYYYRYLHLFQIKDWVGTLRDTARNLQLFDLVHRYAEDEDDQFYLEQWRPYLLRMNAAAAAMIELENSHYSAALECIRTAIAKVENLDEIEDETFQYERDRSLNALREMASQIEEAKPVSELESLEKELRSAIETQHFERAADLRDQIRALRSKERPSGKE